MCPLVSAPNRGYADWQRLENYDTGALYSQSGFTAASTLTSPVIDVSRFAFLGGWWANVGDSVNVTFHWYADSAATVTTGERFTTTSGAGVPQWQMRLFNLGPFLKITWSTVLGGNLNLTTNIFATNRQYPGELIPSSPEIVNVQGVAFVPGATVLTQSGFYAGPALVWFWDDGTSHPTLQMQTLNSAGTYVLFDEIISSSQPGGRYVTVIPFATSQYILVNTSAGNTTCYLAITASTTGST